MKFRRPEPTSTLVFGAALCVIAMLLAGCGGGSTTAPSPSGDLTASGTVIDRVGNSVIAGSTITFSGPVTRTGTVSGGTYQVSGLATGNYTVTIEGPRHVAHKTLGVFVQASGTFGFTAIPWGVSRFGATSDDTFHKFFHQIARVSSSDAPAIRKWTSSPRELYLVTGTVPEQQFGVLATALAEINRTTVPILWCETTAPLILTLGPEPTSQAIGRIVVRPNLNEGTRASLGRGVIQAATIHINAAPLVDESEEIRRKLRGALAHELFHVAGAFHACGGDLGENPYGFSPVNCPFPDSLMANLGDLPVTPSPQDRLAACIIYNPGTLVGNTFPDTNPGYIPR